MCYCNRSGVTEFSIPPRNMPYLHNLTIAFFRNTLSEINFIVQFIGDLSSLEKPAGTEVLCYCLAFVK